MNKMENQMDNRLVIVGVSVILSTLLAIAYFTVESVTTTSKEQLEQARAEKNELSLDNKSLKGDVINKERELNNTIKEKDKEIKALGNELNLTIEPKPLPKNNVYQYGA